MKQTVTVLSAEGGQAMVAYDRPTACHNDCARCAGGCGATAAHERVTVSAENPIGAQPGDRVVVETAGRTVWAAVLLVYVLPVALFFAGYSAGTALGVSGVWSGVGGFFLGVLVTVLAGRRTGGGAAFRIVEFVER